MHPARGPFLTHPRRRPSLSCARLSACWQIAKTQKPNARTRQPQIRAKIIPTFRPAVPGRCPRLSCDRPPACWQIAKNAKTERSHARGKLNSTQNYPNLPPRRGDLRKPRATPWVTHTPHHKPRRGVLIYAAFISPPPHPPRIQHKKSSTPHHERDSSITACIHGSGSQKHGMPPSSH